MEDGEQGNEESHESEKMRGVDDAAMLRHILHTDEQDDTRSNPSAHTEKIAKKFSEIKTDKADVPIEQTTDGNESDSEQYEPHDFIAPARGSSRCHRRLLALRAGLSPAVPFAVLGNFLFQNDITYLKGITAAREGLLQKTCEKAQCARRCSTRRFVSNMMRSSSSVRSARFSMRMRPSTMTVSTDEAFAA